MRNLQLGILILMTIGCGDPFAVLISNKARENVHPVSPMCNDARSANSTFSISASSSGKIDLPSSDLELFSLPTLSAGTKLTATYLNDCDDEYSQLRFEDFELSRDTSIQELDALAHSDPCLLKISRGFTYKINAVSNDPQAPHQGHLDAIRAEEAYDVFYHSTEGIEQEVTIAIIDSGVDIDHPEFAGHIWVNPNEIPNNGVDDDANGYVDDINGWNFAARSTQARNDPRPITWVDDPGGEAHGTHVAGLAAAAWNNGVGGTGIMGKKVKIMALNVFGDSADGSTGKLNEAIRYAADNGADVINLSLGACGFDRTVYDSIMYAVCRGSVVVTAASNTFYFDNGSRVGRELSDDVAHSNVTCSPSEGNQRFFLTPASFGASINGLITVGATDSVANQNAQYEKSDFSAFSPRLVEIGAPGSEGLTAGLLSTSPNNSYDRQRGTSMATPLVAGAVALAKSYSRKKGVELTPMSLERLIVNSAREEQPLNEFFVNGRHLDLLNLATEINNNLNSYQ